MNDEDQMPEDMLTDEAAERAKDIGSQIPPRQRPDTAEDLPEHLEDAQLPERFIFSGIRRAPAGLVCDYAMVEVWPEVEVQVVDGGQQRLLGVMGRGSIVLYEADMLFRPEPGTQMLLFIVARERGWRSNALPYTWAG